MKSKNSYSLYYDDLSLYWHPSTSSKDEINNESNYNPKKSRNSTFYEEHHLDVFNDHYPKIHCQDSLPSTHFGSAGKKNKSSEMEENKWNSSSTLMSLRHLDYDKLQKTNKYKQTPQKSNYFDRFFGSQKNLETDFTNFESMDMNVGLGIKNNYSLRKIKNYNPKNSHFHNKKSIHRSQNISNPSKNIKRIYQYKKDGKSPLREEKYPRKPNYASNPLNAPHRHHHPAFYQSSNPFGGPYTDVERQLVLKESSVSIVHDKMFEKSILDENKLLN